SCGMQVLENYFAKLKQQYRLDPDFAPPELVHIPLGIEARAMVSQVDRARQKKELLPGSKINILCLGRLSCYSKMDILPILRGLQLAGLHGLDLGHINLVLAGGVDRKDDTLKKLSMFASNIGLQTMAFANPDHNLKTRLLAESDIFMSLADNPQETFGLTILEAQAAGLAVIASDYSGYRELIQNQENGLLIPTLGPDNTELIDDLAPLLYDSESHLMLSQSCAADIHQLARTITLVISDKKLRQNLGQKARQNAIAYDWAEIIPRYISLWDEQNQKKHSPEMPDIPHPAQTSYAEIFSGFATGSWLDSAVSQSRLGKAVYKKKDHPVIYSGMAHLIDPQAIRMILFLSRSPVKVPILLARLSAALDMDPSLARIIFAWALKQGLLQASTPAADPEK
ncbi:MAG: glycosyltransferase family 4 protein, partial [Desulfonatronovibrionaceae bacterium]